MMIDYNYPVFTVPIPATLGWKDESGLENLISDWRLLMEYGSDWNLVERSEDVILQICREAGIPRSSISLTREATRLTVITRVVR